MSLGACYCISMMASQIVKSCHVDLLARTRTVRAGLLESMTIEKWLWSQLLHQMLCGDEATASGFAAKH